MMTTPSLACLWCGKPFKPRRCGSPQIFCGAACRSAFHSAGRRWAERAIASGALTVGDLRNGDPQACTLRGRKEGGSSPPGTGSSNSPPPADPPVRFVVEVPATIVRALIFTFRYLPFDQRDDLPAILAALDRLGRKPSITRIG